MDNKSRCKCGHEQNEHGMSEVCLHTVYGNFDCDCEKFQPCVEPDEVAETSRKCMEEAHRIVFDKNPEPIIRLDDQINSGLSGFISASGSPSHVRVHLPEDAPDRYADHSVPPEPQGRIVLKELTLAMQQTGAKTQTHRNIQAGFNEGLKHQLIHNSIELIVREASANTQLQPYLDKIKQLEDEVSYWKNLYEYEMDI
jgi:hypothetical protein